MKRSMIAIPTVSLVLVLAGCSGGGSADADKRAMEENAVIHQVTDADLATTKSTEPIAGDSAVLWVNGLGCPLCATNIDKQLERIRGVDTVGVDLSTGQVTLNFKPGGARPSPARINDAVLDAGFTLVRVEAR